jgi:hypothetical protein
MSAKIELRKKDNQLIIGRIPSWIAQWGNLVILGIFLLLLYISFHLTFPVIVQGQIQVSNKQVYIVVPALKQELIRAGQAISLYVDDYPYMETGILQGKVSGEKLPQGQAIWISVSLSDEKNQIKRSDLIPGMNGRGEIIIDRIPIIYKILKIKS